MCQFEELDMADVDFKNVTKFLDVATELGYVRYSGEPWPVTRGDGEASAGAELLTEGRARLRSAVMGSAL